MNLLALHDLVGAWRSEAELFRRRGRASDAELVDSYASDLAQRLDEWQLEALTLQEAATESGYSYSSLQQQVAAGAIPNAGEAGSPRIRRLDLPSKGARKALSIETGEPDLAGEIVDRGRVAG